MLQDELHVIDRRTGRTYDIPIRHNAIRALDFAKIKESEDLPSSGRPSQGLRVLDEALDNVALRTSRITFLDSENGVLCYRGFDVAGLIGKVTWEEACHLLIWGNIPDTKALLKFKIRLGQAGGRPPQAVFTAIQDLPRDAPAVSQILAGLAALLATQKSTIPAFVGRDIYWKNTDIVDSSIIRMLATCQAVIAIVCCHRWGRSFTDPDLNPDRPYLYNLLQMIGRVDSITGKPNTKELSWLGRILITYADHEMSCSTMSFLLAASAHCDPLSCFISSAAAVYGIIHGGALDATWKMLQRFEKKENVHKLIEAVKQKNEVLFGFGHRIYAVQDPRVNIFKGIVQEIQTDRGYEDPLLEVAEEIDRIASQDPFFVERKIRINGDFYAAFAIQAVGLPQDAVFPLLLFSRLQGYLAHWCEFMADAPRIIRGRQVYVGDSKKPLSKL